MPRGRLPAGLGPAFAFQLLRIATAAAVTGNDRSSSALPG